MTRALPLLLLLGCVTPERHDFHRSADVMDRAGLGWGVARWTDLAVEVHPLSDGGSWPVSGREDGLTYLYDDAGKACWSYPGYRVLVTAKVNSWATCHGLGHVARSDRRGPDGACISELHGGEEDHAYFARVGLDAMCREAFSAASDGTP